MAGLVAYAFRPGPNLRAGSVKVGGSVGVARRLPGAYAVVYRDETHAAGETTVSTQKLWLRRPFESRSETWSGPPPGRRRLSYTVNALTRLSTGRITLAVPPGPAPDERRPDAFLPEATKRGYAQTREARRIIGRACRVYRIGGDPGIDSLKPLKRVGKDYSDVCVDAAGIVLEHVSFTDGKLLFRRVAAGVDENPPLNDDMFAVGKPSMGAAQGGGSARRADPASRPPGTFWALSRPLDGFRHAGRWAVVPPQSGFNDPIRRASIVAWVSDVYTRGSDVVVVEQGATLQGVEPFKDDPNAQDVDAGALGRGELLYGLRAAELQVKFKGGKFVRLIGTVPPSRLVEIAKDLRRESGGTLVYLDEGPS